MRRIHLFSAAGTMAVLFVGLSGCGTFSSDRMMYEAALSDADYSFERSVSQVENIDLPVLDRDSRLADYLAYAALNNPGLKSEFEQWRAALNAIPQAQALSDPRLTYSYYIRSVETRVGPQQHSLTLSQRFPWFGTIEARTDAAAFAARAAYQRYQARKLQVFEEVKSAYAEYAYLHRAIGIAGENLELLEFFEEVARTKYMVATATHPEVIRAQVELAKVLDILNSLQDLKQPVIARLNSALNRPIDVELPTPQPIEPAGAITNKEEILARVKSRNPELEAIQNLIEEARSRVALAEKRFWPDVSVGLGWIQTGEAANPAVSDSGMDPVILTFAMNIPIWRESYAAAVRQAQARVRMHQYRQENTENALLVAAEQSLYKYEDSQRKLELYGRILVPKAEQLLQVSETAYAAGDVDFLSLIDAQRMLLKFSLEYEQSLRDNLQAFAEVERLAGGWPENTP